MALWKRCLACRVGPWLRDGPGHVDRGPGHFQLQKLLETGQTSNKPLMANATFGNVSPMESGRIPSDGYGLAKKGKSKTISDFFQKPSKKRPKLLFLRTHLKVENVHHIFGKEYIFFQIFSLKSNRAIQPQRSCWQI